MEELQIPSSVNPVGVFRKGHNVVVNKRYKAEMLCDAVWRKIRIQGERAFSYCKCSLFHLEKEGLK